MTPSAAIAAHRFGLGEASLAAVGADAPGWLLAQLGPADVQVGIDLPDTAAALARTSCRAARRSAAGSRPASRTLRRRSHSAPAWEADITGQVPSLIWRIRSSAGDLNL